MPVFKQIQAIVLLPGVMTLLIPGLIAYSTGALKNTWLKAFPIAILPLLIGACLLIPGLIAYSTGALKNTWLKAFPIAILPLLIGACLVGAGLTLTVQTIRLFITSGNGTLAPWTPTRTLVVQGIYRHVRNPMISGVFCILLGEAVLMGSLALFYWFLGFVLINLVYIPILDEPGLVMRFGEDYQIYQRHVPRWIPRMHPWMGLEDEIKNAPSK